MVSNKKLASAVGGKTARACDSCIRKRARWYCAADDAFLCQACDGSVHSANPLARRHERVRLKTSSFMSSDEGQSQSRSPLENSEPSWHHGFTRKARTPRNGKQSAYHRRRQQPKSEEPTQNSHPLVPELGAGETYSNEENEEQLLYRVPVFDPFVSELCSSAKSNEFANNSLRGFLPNSETEIDEFAADVESLLGKGLDGESFDMEALGLLDCKQKESVLGVKIEEEGDTGGVQLANHVDEEMDVTRELSFEFNFDCDSPATCEEGEDEVMRKKKNTKLLLRLDYEAVTRAWANQKSPWTTSDRPELNPSDCWGDCMGSCGRVHNPCVGVMGGHSAMVDSGREARVSRYREKRRTRLFSKKIRYEVRKLNAEKRPRMKGRFVKRANFAGPSFSLLGK